MSAEAIYKAIRDLLVVGAIAFIAWRVYSDGKNSVKAEQFEQLQKQVAQQSETLKQWNERTEDANKKLFESLSRINAAPVLSHDWVRDEPRCIFGKVLSGPATAASDSTNSRRAILPGPGAATEPDRRDQIVADFKRFWEEKLAGCRALYDSWPVP